MDQQNHSSLPRFLSVEELSLCSPAMFVGIWKKAFISVHELRAEWEGEEGVFNRTQINIMLDW